MMGCVHPLTVGLIALDAAPVLAAEGADGGPLWTVLGMGAVILLAYGVTRVVTGPLLRTADEDVAASGAADTADAPSPEPAAPAPQPTSAALEHDTEPLPGSESTHVRPAVSMAGTAADGGGTAVALRAGVIEIDPLRRRVEVDGERLDLTDTEYRLLSYLVDHTGQVLSRTLLLRDVWGHKEAVYSRTVDTHIQRLRDKLGAAREQLETVRGAGYRLRDA